MKTRDFFTQLDEARLTEAIAQAEALTSGEIRVFISHKKVSDAFTFAQKQFLKLGMIRTRERNAVLIFVAPRSHTFAVIGDEAVHAQCGDLFWQDVVIAMTTHFRSGDFTAGLIDGISRTGKILATHFPPRPDDENELPDRIEHD